MDANEFDRLLKVCRISLSRDEKDRIINDIEEIIKYFNTLNEFETGNTSESYHAIQIPERLRQDKVEAFQNTNGILKNTKTYRFYVVGPKI